jgi:hypothetical protein
MFMPERKIDFAKASIAELGGKLAGRLQQNPPCARPLTKAY